jgi:hypothetical protein
MLVNVITRYPRRAAALLEQAFVENDNAFGAHSIAGTTRYLLPAVVQSGQAFGNNAVGFAPKKLEQSRVQNASAFGASTIENLAPGVRHLVSTTVVNTSGFGTAQVRVSNRYLLQARIANAHQFGAANVHFAIRQLTQSKVTNPNQFGAMTIAVVAATAVSAIIPSDADTTFVNSEGAARATMAGGASVNLDG